MNVKKSTRTESTYETDKLKFETSSSGACGYDEDVDSNT